jgi:hypothetical protein
MLITKPVLKRSRIREVVPEVLPPNGAAAWPEPPEKLEPRAFSETAETTREEAAASARAEKAPRADAARQEAAQLEGALLQAAREEAAHLAAAREETGLAEARPVESARTVDADLAATSADAAAPVIPAPAQDEAILGEPVRGVPEESAETPAAEVRPETTEATELQPPVTEPTEWTCEISFWRGYRKGAFYARTYDGEEEVAVGESPLFRPHGNGLPEPTLEAEDAYNALCEQLEREGWTLVETGETWFDATFQLEITAAAEPGPE